MRSSNSALVAALLLAGCGGAPTRTAPAPELARNARGYDVVGVSSWYGEELAGHLTASGERFDPGALTAAHRSLPLGSLVEVLSLDSGKAVVVRINDRGPSDRSRIIDLSRGAARALGVDRVALPLVRVRAVDAMTATRIANRDELAALRRQAPARRAPLAPQPITLQPGALLWVQVAAFSDRNRARALADRLGGDVGDGQGVYRIRLGPFDDADAAERARDAAASQGYGDATIITSVTDRHP